MRRDRESASSADRPPAWHVEGVVNAESPSLPPRRERELRTIAVLIARFCRDHHTRTRALCTGCDELTTYARRRLERCPYGEAKPACTNCPIHCYQPKIRAQIRAVMRYAGPRLLLTHPILALRHWLDERKPVPDRPGRLAAPERG